MEIGTSNTGKVSKVCKQISRPIMEDALIKVFVTSNMASSIESSLEGLFDNLFRLTFDGENDVIENASDYLIDSAIHTFLLLAKYDAKNDPLCMSFTKLIAEKFSVMVRENFSKLIQFIHQLIMRKLKRGKSLIKKITRRFVRNSLISMRSAASCIRRYLTLIRVMSILKFRVR